MFFIAANEIISISFQNIELNKQLIKVVKIKIQSIKKQLNSSPIYQIYSKPIDFNVTN